MSTTRQDAKALHAVYREVMGAERVDWERANMLRNEIYWLALGMNAEAFRKAKLSKKHAPRG